MDVCIAEGGDALDLAPRDSRWLQRQHRLEDGVELCYARHGCDVRRQDRYSLLQPISAVPSIEEIITVAESTTKCFGSKGK